MNDEDVEGSTPLKKNLEEICGSFCFNSKKPLLLLRIFFLLVACCVKLFSFSWNQQKKAEKGERSKRANGNIAKLLRGAKPGRSLLLFLAPKQAKRWRQILLNLPPQAQRIKIG